MTQKCLCYSPIWECGKCTQGVKNQRAEILPVISVTTNIFPKATFKEIWKIPSCSTKTLEAFLGKNKSLSKPSAVPWADLVGRKILGILPLLLNFA